MVILQVIAANEIATGNDWSIYIKLGVETLMLVYIGKGHLMIVWFTNSDLIFTYVNAEDNFCPYKGDKRLEEFDFQ